MATCPMIWNNNTELFLQCLSNFAFVCVLSIHYLLWLSCGGRLSLHYPHYTTPTQAGIYFAPIVSTFSRIISHSLWQGKPTKHPSMLMKGWIKNDECYDNITIALLQPHKLPISLFSYKNVSFNLQQADFLKIFLKFLTFGRSSNYEMSYTMAFQILLKRIFRPKHWSDWDNNIGTGNKISKRKQETQHHLRWVCFACLWKK